MHEIRVHGRGGQGAVLASLILARAARREGRFVQAFPEFGVERRGAPVSAFLRLDERPILIRSRIASPDHLLVLDPRLLEVSSTWEGLRSGGSLVINLGRAAGASPLKEWEPLILSQSWKVFGVEASSLAAGLGIGSPTAPVANTAMAGAFVKATGLFRLDSVLEAIRETVPEDREKNVQAANEAYEKTRPLVT